MKNKNEKICQRCKKNKATIRFTEGALAYSHGFIEDICKKCYDKMQRATPLYKKAINDFAERIKEYVKGCDIDCREVLYGIDKIEKEMKG